LPKICDAGGIAKDGIGAIRVTQEVTYVQIAEALAPRFGASLEIDQGLSMERMEGEPDLGRPERPARVGVKPEGRAPKREYQPKPPRVVEEDEAPAEAARKVWPKREAAEERKPYVKREDGDRKPYAPREGAERKPYVKREEGERKPYAPREGAERKPYARAEGAERKPDARRDGSLGEAPKKPRWTPDDKARRGAAEEGGKPAFKSAGYRSHGGSPDRPAKSAGYRSHAAEGTGYKGRSDAGEDRKSGGEAAGGRKPWAGKGQDAKPYARKAEGKPEGKSWGGKSHAEGGKKPYAPKGDKPFAARKPAAKPVVQADARDTSKRFVPPKKPKG
jgi:ATP-dependent RNA helicase DeaD